MYDIKVYYVVDGKRVEKETVRNLTETQMIVLRQIFTNNGISHSVKKI